MLHLLDPLLLEDIQNPEHPSDFIARDSFVILVLRLPELKNNIVHVVSYAFVIQEDRAYIYDREENSLKELGSLIEMNEFLDNKTDDLIKEIKQYHYEIDELEESLYEAKLDTHFMQKWLTYKKDVSRSLSSLVKVSSYLTITKLSVSLIYHSTTPSMLCKSACLAWSVSSR